MKKIYTICLIVVGTIHSFLSYGSHISGSEINYACTSTSGVYQITVRLYRDCSGIPLGSCTGSCSTCSYTIAYMGIDSGCTTTGTILLNLLNVKDVGGLNVKNICNNNGCSLNGTFSPGYEIYTFQGTVNFNTIPSSCCQIKLYIQECCISNFTNTNFGGSGNNNYCETTLNRCLATCDNSPRFTTFENGVYQSGQPVYQSFAATDADGDSLSYNFSQWPVTYQTGYNNYPFIPFAGSSIYNPAPNGFHFDTLTGFMQFTPSVTSTFWAAMAVSVNEFRTINGAVKKIGSITRYFVNLITLSPGSSKMHVSTSAQSPYSEPVTDYYVCAGNPLNFNVIAKDTNYTFMSAVDTSTIVFDTTMLMPGMVISNNYNIRPREDSKHFTWTPDTTFARAQPYSFTVYIKNKATPVPAWESRTFRIFVSKPIPSNIGITKTQDVCKKWQLSFSNTSVLNSYKWYVNKSITSSNFKDSFINVITTPLFSFGSSGKFPVKLTVGNNGCAASFTDTIAADTPMSIAVNDTIVCAGGVASFTYHAQHGNTPGLNAYTYRWFIYPDTFVNPINAPFYNSNTYAFIPSSTKRYTLQARDLNGCRAYDSSVWVGVSSPSFTGSKSATICNGTMFTIDKGNNNGNVRSYYWSNSATTRTIQSNISSSFSLMITDTTGCTNTDSFNLQVLPKVDALTGTDTTACAASKVFLKASGGQQYQWKNLNTQTIISPVSMYGDTILKVYQSTSFELTAWVTSNGVTCFGKDTMNVSINPLPVMTRPAALELCAHAQPASLQSFNPSPSGGIGNWMYTSNPTAISGNMINPDQLIIQPSKTNTSVSNWVSYSYQLSTGCSILDSEEIKLFAIPEVHAAATSSFCSYDPSFNLSASQTGSPAGGVWNGLGVSSVAGDYYFNPSMGNVFPAGNMLYYNYTKYYTANTSCSNSDSINFMVFPKPPLPFLNGPILVNRGAPINYFVSTNTTGSFNWMIFNGNIISGNGTQIVSTSFNNLGSGMIKVVRTDTNQCKSDTSTKTITVIAGVGLKEQSGFDHFNMYPNPTSALLNIEFNSPENKIHVEVIDLLGRIVKLIDFENNYSSFKTTLDLSSFTKGIYFVQVKAGVNVMQTKITLQ